jgi:hypothetical protein
MDISSLIALAGNTLVAAAVTDAWETARNRVARLFGRGEPDPTTVRRLDATRSQLAAAAPADLEHVQADLAGQWAVRLADLLEENPGVEADLRSLVDELESMLAGAGPSAADHSVVAGGNVNVIGLGGGITAGVIHGGVSMANPSRPGPPDGQDSD